MGGQHGGNAFDASTGSWQRPNAVSQACSETMHPQTLTAHPLPLAPASPSTHAACEDASWSHQSPEG